MDRYLHNRSRQTSDNISHAWGCRVVPCTSYVLRQRCRRSKGVCFVQLFDLIAVWSRYFGGDGTSLRCELPAKIFQVAFEEFSGSGCVGYSSRVVWYLPTVIMTYFWKLKLTHHYRFKLVERSLQDIDHRLIFGPILSFLDDCLSPNLLSHGMVPFHSALKFKSSFLTAVLLLFIVSEIVI